ncbi:MAG: sugar ABC transporter permease [Acidimicrobiia bacterium]|nr:sugar ABC transporter permease [Acidimicrobiia bacterium]MDH4309243.1 sugar ABC transporter permease [Acidimicrobiia bacterium]
MVRSTNDRRRRQSHDAMTGRTSLDRNETLMGWLFIAPALIGLVVFLVIPILMTVYVSLTDWSGATPPLQAEVTGTENYQELLLEDGLRRKDFARAVRNNLWYVVGVVPTQTAIAFVLAAILNQKVLKGKGFFRTAYYFPSITSSVAVTLMFVFLFQTRGLVNSVLPFQDINWFDNSNGLIHNLLGVFGVSEPPIWMEREVFSLEIWEWIAGPSVAMTAIMLLVTWTTVGTMMLIFLAGLQSISPSIEEAAMVDGASGWQRFWGITVPMMRPTIFFVVTLGLIGTWQVFDQVYVATFGGPRKATITPAFWIYFQSFDNSAAGLGAAMAVVLFAIIMAFDWMKRRLVADTGEV